MGGAWDSDEVGSYIYRDDGCSLHSRCLTCPLPACRYDMPPRQAQAWMLDLRVASLMAEGVMTDEIAERVGISRRTLFRSRARIKARREEVNGGLETSDAQGQAAGPTG